MAASSKQIIAEAERRFPCRIKLGIPAGGFGTRLTEIHAWLDETAADGWAITPADLRGVIPGADPELRRALRAAQSYGPGFIA